jgi:hypothetical protein
MGVLGIVIACIAPTAASAQTGCAPYGAGCPAPPGTAAPAATGGGSGIVSNVAGGVQQAVVPARAAAPQAAAQHDFALTGSESGRQMRIAGMALALGIVLVCLGRKPKLQVT